MFSNILGVLIVLQALSLQANARNTSSPIQQKTQAVVVISVLDQTAFTDADIRSLRRFVHNVLPHHEFIHITENAPSTWGDIISPGLVKDIRESLQEQIRTRIGAHHEISHLILMDHGNTDFEGKNNKTHLRYLSSFDGSTVSEQFRTLFEPLSGRFSENAFVMLESCLTVCDSLFDSKKRAKTLMDFFKIKNGTLFGSYQQMVSVGYEKWFHYEQFVGRMKNPIILGVSLALGIAANIDFISQGSFSFSNFFLAAGVSNIAFAGIFKTISYIHDKTNKVNWGYLYNFKNSNLETVYNLQPYENKNDLFLKAVPKKATYALNRCSLLFH